MNNATYGLGLIITTNNSSTNLLLKMIIAVSGFSINTMTLNIREEFLLKVLASNLQQEMIISNGFTL